MIEDLRKNIGVELGIVTEISSFLEQAPPDDPAHHRMITDIVRSLKKKLQVVNSAVPTLVKQISLVQALPDDRKRSAAAAAEAKTAERIKAQPLPQPVEEVAVDPSQQVMLPRELKKQFINELRISDTLIKRLKKKKRWLHEKEVKYKKTNMYGKMSNKFFLKTSQRMINRGYFKSLGLDIRRSNMGVLTVTYISMMFFSVMLAVIGGLLITILALIFELKIAPPFIGLYDGSYFTRFVQVIWIMFATPILVFVMFYFYPGAEQKSTAKRIDQELPFVVVHMGSIAGSGIEPIEIFKIIAMSKDYKYAGQEIKKILNQTNVYGYDLTTALRNVARSTPSQRLSELLNGMSITINSGGDIKVFFEKRAESLLLEYRIEREKSTKNAETVMDIYISVVISTPMILLLLLIMVSVSGISLGGLSVDVLSVLVIAAVAMINVVFLGFLQLRQPAY